MNDSNIVGSFTFSISDKILDFGNIKENLKISPSKIIRRGQTVGGSKSRLAPYDIWTYEKKITDVERPFSQLEDLLEVLRPYLNYIKKISQQYDQVDINCYIRSDYGQIGFELTKDVVRKLNEFNLNVNFHILSFGEVEN